EHADVNFPRRHRRNRRRRRLGRRTRRERDRERGKDDVTQAPSLPRRATECFGSSRVVSRRLGGSLWSMARKGRGGFRPPEIRGTLGTLLRTTRDVLERGAREGRERLDEVMAGRRRSDALAELGEIVLDLVRRGEIAVEELPEAREVIAHLDEL